MKVFVLTGQSNSLGTSGDPHEADITPGQAVGDAQIPFFWANRSTRTGDGPAVDPAFRYVDTLDLRPQLYDGLHFNKPAKLELGRRLAKAWLDWV
ncbi:MAG: hypothetical protein WC708_19295 [Lentisphaeria bacterium]